MGDQHTSTLEATMLLYYGSSGEPWGGNWGTAQIAAADRFYRAGLLEKTEGPDRDGTKPHLSYIGKFEAIHPWMEAVCCIPLPVKTWAIPDPTKD